MFRDHRTTVLCLGLVCVLGLPGCASTGKRQQEAELNARRAISHLNIGADHLQAGRSAMALREFLAGAKLDPQNPRLQYALGEAYLARQRPEESEQHFLRAIELHPEHHDARLSLSALYIVQGRYEESAATCDTLLDDPTFPSPWRALANKGWAEFKLGRNAASRTSLQQALDYSPTYWPAMLSMAVLEASEGRRREAIALLQEVIELDPGPRVTSEANYRLAENYIALGRRDRAVGYLTTAVARAPEGEWARRSQEYLKLLR
ncbi:MAG: tetratricopeptide repeat protein [Myxococcota bacterium]